MSAPSGSPIVLSAKVSMRMGATAQPDLSLLVSPVQRPILAHEISFAVKIPGPEPSVTSLALHFLPFLRASMQLGRYAITDGFVPVSNFAPRYSYYYSHQWGTGYVGVAVPTGAGGAGIFNHRRWILPRPMYMAPGEGLRVTFQLLQQIPTLYSDLGKTTLMKFLSDNWDIRVSIAGRILNGPIAASSRRIPYVSAFLPDSAQLNSGETDLRNALGAPVEVQRLVGDVWRLADNTAQPVFGPFDIAGSTPDSHDGNWPISLRIQSSQGNYVVTNTGQASSSSNFVRWESVFPAPEPVLPFHKVLDPGERLSVQFAPGGLFQNTTYNAGQGVFYNLNQLANISLVGSREEALDG
jgi:hypothetical protein